MDDIQKYAAEQRTEPEQMTNGEAKPKAINSTQRTKSDRMDQTESTDETQG
ncbi:hypothetical protein LJK87_47190 [Paenibacillus sp. P25]|nr:hypothetical protein LJK87_47190 [Paenibacillus sp. P25]